MNRRLLALLVAASTVVVTGCGIADQASPPDPTPGSSAPPSSSSTADPYADVSQADGLRTIPVDGVEGSTLIWRLNGTPSAGSPVSVTQRFLALHALADTPGTDTDPAVVSSVADGDQLAATRNRVLGRTEGQDESGPLWVWLDTADETDDRAEVRGCADVGYFQPSGTSTPAPASDRAEAWRTELEQVEDSDGAEVWKVSAFSRGPVDDGDPFEARCAAWATHTP